MKLFDMFPMIDFDDEDEDGYNMSSSSISTMTMHRNQLRHMMKEASRRSALFDQGEVWVNAEGRYVPISEISARYADNIIAHLEANARVDAEMVFIWKNVAGDANSFSSWTDDDCINWLRDTKLYRALREASERPF